MGKPAGSQFLRIQGELREVLQAYRHAIREVDERLKFQRTQSEIETLNRLKEKLVKALNLSFEIASDFVEALGGG
jgi:hypothetical protein